MKQLALFKEKIETEFGGTLLRRRCRRPLDRKKPHHLVLKANNSIALLRNKTQVGATIHRFACKFGIKIHELGIHADHIHIAFGFPDRAAYVRWIRAITSVLVVQIKNLKWKFRPYTRVVRWGRAFARLREYIVKNRIEGDFILAALTAAGRFRTKAAAAAGLPP